MFRSSDLTPQRARVFLFIAAGLAGSVTAQVPVVPQDRPAERALSVPDSAPPPAPGFELPPVELAPPPAAAGAPALRVLVTAFRFTGNTVFSADELAAVAAPYRAAAIGNHQLETLRAALTRYYVDRGYINSGAVLPDQDVTDGVITYRIVEGRLSDIVVNGMRELRRAYVRERAALAAGPPMNVFAVRDRLFLLQQDPRIERLDAALLPGTRPGEARLRLDVEEAPARQLDLTLANNRPPSVGGERTELGWHDVNLLGFGDTLGLRAGHSEGSDDIDLSYALALNAYDTTLQLRYAATRSNVVEAPFDDLDVESEATTASIGLSHPVHHAVQSQATLGAALEQRETESSLLGEPFAFSPGTPPDGKLRLAVLRLTQTWQQHDPAQVLAARSTFSFGLDELDASVNEAGEPDGRYSAWLGQLQWVRRLLARRDELVLRLDAQFSDGPVPSIEQFSAGGARSVRGYRESELVRDAGVFTSAEYRFTVWSDPHARHRTQLAVFYDRARLRNPDRRRPDTDELASIGAGVRAAYSPWLTFELYYGERLEDVEDDDGDDLQDRGIHFQLRAQYR